MAHKPRHGKGDRHGTLQRGASGIWLARWYADGKRFARSTGTRDKREAERKLEDFVSPYMLKSKRDRLDVIAARIKGIDGEIERIQNERPALRLADAFEAYRASAARSDAGERTLSGYEAYLSAFVRWMALYKPEAVEMRDVTAADAAAYATHFTAGHSAGTFNKHITFLRCLWATIEKEDAEKEDTERQARLSCNPWANIALRKHIVHSRRELTLAELCRVCEEVKGEMRLLFALGIYTGQRLGDCALLDWGNVDVERGIISLVPKKTARKTGGRRVVVPLHATLAGMLAETPIKKRRGLVLPEIGAAYRRDSTNITRRVRDVFERCGIQTGSKNEKTGRKMVDVGFHSLRHTFVSMSANAGAPMAVVQSLVGHGSPAMTRHYYHESADALKSAVCALPDLTGAHGRADGAESVGGGRFSAVCALMDGMDAAGLRSVLEEVERRLERLV